MRGAGESIAGDVLSGRKIDVGAAALGCLTRGVGKFFQAAKGLAKFANAGKTTKRGPLPNNGNARPHGGDHHNSAIDQRANQLKQDQSVSNIRKNQQQVDVNGNKVGANRPDLQFDQNGCHHCVEFDKIPINSGNHGDVIQANDPNAIFEANIIR